MAINNSQKKEETIPKTAIANALRDIRRNRYNAEKLFQILEKVDDFYITDEHFKKVALGERSFDNADTMELLYQSFCEAYTIRLLEKYLDYSKRDLKLLLAILGFLPSYKNLKVKERRIAYAKENPNVRFENNLVSGWGDPNSRLLHIENGIIDKVAKQLDRETCQNEKPLGLVTVVLNELAERFPAGLPEELPADFLKGIRIDSPSDNVPSQNVILDDKINSADSDCGESLSTDTTQAADDDLIDLDDEGEEYELKDFMDDELEAEDLEDAEESSEELSEQDSLPSYREVRQFLEDSENAFTDDSEDDASDAAFFFRVGKLRKKLMLLDLLVLGASIWLLCIIHQKVEDGNVIKTFLSDLVGIVVFVASMPILFLLSGKISDFFDARKRSPKARRSYTVQQIKDGVLGERIVFNSISDGSYGWGCKGNEKKFISAGKIEGEDGVWKFRAIEVEDGAEYLIRVFIHNDNPNGYDAVAKHCRAKIHIPAISSKIIRVYGSISSSNASPEEYWDSIIFFNIHTPFDLVILGPAMLYNNGVGRDGYSLSWKAENVEGALIGYDYCDGEIPGGDGYESNILLKVKVIFDNDFTIKFRGYKYVSDGWRNTVEANIWDTVNFQIGYKNSSNAKEPQENVTVSIELPECLCYVPSSASLHATPRPFSRNIGYDDYNYDSLFLPGGLNIGYANPGVSATILFKAEVIDRGLSPGSNEALATVKITVGEVTNYDTVKVIVNKELLDDCDED